jgi:hypothetical protein
MSVRFSGGYMVFGPGTFKKVQEMVADNNKQGRPVKIALNGDYHPLKDGGGAEAVVITGDADYKATERLYSFEALRKWLVKQGLPEFVNRDKAATSAVSGEPVRWVSTYPGQ